MRTFKLVLGFGLGLSSAVSAGSLDNCNSLLTACHQGIESAWEQAIRECLA